MKSVRRELLRYAEFLSDSGILYLEGEPREAPRETRRTPESSAAPPSERRPPARTPRIAEEEAMKPPRAEPKGPMSDQLDFMSVSEETAPTGATPLGETERAEAGREGAARAAACTACPLHEGRTQSVYGTGSLMAKIVFVGEGPGAEEDRTGIPFVGRGGKLLTKMIEAIGFSREEVYICNTVKCRPPENRDPLPSEKKACEPFLFEQLEIIRPQILVGLGAHACSYLTGLQTSLGKQRMRWHRYRGIPVMATYHPAFLLRSPSFKRQAWEDMQMLAAKYAELNPDDPHELWKGEA